MKPVRAQQNLIEELHFHIPREDAQVFGAADRHSENMPHGMFFQSVVAEPEPRAYFGYPGLIFGKK